MTVRPTSVIVCTHNRASLLPGIISQLRAQNYPPDAFEIIVVDNCSIDHTPEVVQGLVPESGIPVHYVAESRPGVTFARNRGAEEAQFPYLTYLDDDCSVEPDWLLQLMSGFDLDTNVIIVAGRIMVDIDERKKPKWLGSKSERWLGAYNFPGTQPRLLAFPLYVCEGNMALKREAWKAVGGFLGMDQFGSPHVAAQEIGYLLKQIERQGGKVAFVPGAFARHHPDMPTRQWILRRAYFHGVSDGMLDYCLYRRSWLYIAIYTLIDVAAMIVFLLISMWFYLLFNESTAIYHLLRATARIGKVLSEMRLVGDWPRVRTWMSKNESRINRI